MRHKTKAQREYDESIDIDRDDFVGEVDKQIKRLREVIDVNIDKLVALNVVKQQTEDKINRLKGF